MNNANYIKSLSNEKLSEFIANYSLFNQCQHCSYERKGSKDFLCGGNCFKGMTEWLNTWLKEEHKSET